KGLAPDTAELFPIPHPRHPKRDGGEDEGDDDHEEHAQEDLPYRIGHILHDPAERLAAAPEIVRNETGDQPEAEAYQYPGMEGDSFGRAALCVHDTCFDGGYKE